MVSQLVVVSFKPECDDTSEVLDQRADSHRAVAVGRAMSSGDGMK
jgi:hypothetical protein